MDQKNTIVKCKAHPDCLFNHNGVCDNYVINIGADGRCESYVETENAYAPPNVQEILEYTIKLEQEKLRGQRAKCNFINDGVDQEIVNEVCKPFLICSTACQEYNWRGASPYCSAFQEYLGPERLMKPCERFKGEK